MFKYIFRDVTGNEIDYDFPRLTWRECMDTYGVDKPDLRFGLPIVDVTDIAAESDFSVFNAVTAKGGVVRAICIPDKGDPDRGGFTRTEIETLTDKAVSFGAKGMAWIALRNDGSVNSILDKYFTKEQWNSLLTRVNAKDGDFILFSADKLSGVRRVLGNLRLVLGDMLGLRGRDDFKFMFVTQFPQFEFSEEEGRYMAAHHPFTMPFEEDVQYLFTEPGRVRSHAYDVVLNGTELGSGSVRIHDPEIQRTMFRALGFTDEQAQSRFGFMINAFRYGTPPHAGFAFGLDRFVMLLVGASSLREVIAFPKIKDASCPMTDAPDTVDGAQLSLLGIGIIGEDGNIPTGEKLASAKKSAPKIDIDNIAALSRLYLDDSQKAKYAADMADIIGFANELSSVDTTGVTAREHIGGGTNVFREDVAKSPQSREEILANAKTAVDGYYSVPITVEE
jgi:aspartyl-tRNA synthetase